MGTIGNKAFSIDCFMLDLGVVWDFVALAMSFWYNGRSHHWTGVSNRGVAACAIADPRAVLEELLQSY